MNTRLKELRKILNLKQKDIASSLNITISSISKIEKGEVILTDRNISAICSAFSVNENWLRNGIEPIFIPQEEIKDSLSAFEQIKKENNLDQLSSSFLSTYLNLDDFAKQNISNFFKTAIEDYYLNNLDELHNLDKKLVKSAKLEKLQAIAYDDETLTEAEVNMDEFNKFFEE